MEGGIEFGLKLVDHIAYSLLASAIVILLAFLVVRRREKGVPKGWQNAGEYLIEMLMKLLGEDFPERLLPTVVPFLTTFFVFILICNWVGLLPHGLPPTADLSTTVALALVAVVGFQVISVSVHGGWGAFKQFLKPVAFFAPLKIIDNLARVLSLSLRLFGNITGEHIVAHIVGLIIPLFFPVILSMLGLLVGGIQAVVFTMLAMKYLAEEVGAEHLREQEEFSLGEGEAA